MLSPLEIGKIAKNQGISQGQIAERTQNPRIPRSTLNMILKGRIVARGEELIEIKKVVSQIMAERGRAAAEFIRDLNEQRKSE